MQKLRKITLRAALVLLATAIVAFTWINLSLASPGSLPDPTGPYLVGRTEFDWIDESRVDPFASSAGRKRELDVFVWYPAERPGTKHAVYLRDNWLRSLRMPFPTPEYRRVRTHSWPDVAIARPQASGWPVVILSSGFGALPTNYSSLAEDLASRGYVVAAPANTYVGPTVVFPDGRIAKSGDSFPDLDRFVRVWADDIGTVIRKLAALNQDSSSPLYRKLDLRRVGVIGHSFGGAASAEFCAMDETCGAGIDMDGALHGDPLEIGIPRPFLFMVSDRSFGLPGRLNSQTRNTWEASYRQYLARDRAVCALSPDCRVEIEPGFRHMNFTDLAVLFRPPLLWTHPALGGIGGDKGLDLVRKRVAQFLDRWIRH